MKDQISQNLLDTIIARTETTIREIVLTELTRSHFIILEKVMKIV